MGYALAGSWEGVAEAADLRRRRKAELVEALAARAEGLGEADRALVLAAYRDGKRAVELAPLVGQGPRQIRRRLRGLVERLMSREYACVLSRRERWTPIRRRVADACVLRGRSLRVAARELGMSLHAVRRHRDAVLALAHAEEELARDRRGVGRVGGGA